MNKPIFDIDKVGMHAFLTARPAGEGLVWQTLFPLKVTPRFELKALEGDEGLPITADRVEFNLSAPEKTRKVVGSWSGQLTKIAVGRSKDEKDINDYQELQVLSAANGQDTDLKRALVDLVYDDLTFVARGIDARIELDALRIGSSGAKVYSADIKGDYVQEEQLNFNIPTENLSGVTNVWSDAKKADGIDDIVKAMKGVRSRGFVKPQYAIMEEQKFEQLRSQEATIKRIYPFSKIDNVLASNVDLETVNAYMKRMGYPTIIVIDSYVAVEAHGGTIKNVKPWNVEVVALSATPNLGYTFFKRVPETPNVAALQTYGTHYKVTRYSTVNPMKETTTAEAYVQPVLTNRHSLCLINTNSTEWVAPTETASTHKSTEQA